MSTLSCGLVRIMGPGRLIPPAHLSDFRMEMVHQVVSRQSRDGFASLLRNFINFYHRGIPRRGMGFSP
jgi:hypothetical protein